MTERRTPLWPSREEWAAAAEHFARTICDPTERVSEDPAHWLTAEELTEQHDQLAEAVKLTRRAIGRALRAETDQPAVLKADRHDLNTHARDVRRERATVTDMVFGLNRVLKIASRHLDAETPCLHRLGVLRNALATRRRRAAEEALQAAINREVARRNSDEGWAKELERRRRIAQPTITVINLT